LGRREIGQEGQGVKCQGMVRRKRVRNERNWTRGAKRNRSRIRKRTCGKRKGVEK
jgi:hypothetical protein